MLRGSLADWEYELRARLAVNEEEDELARMRVATEDEIVQIQTETHNELARIRAAAEDELARIRNAADGESARMASKVAHLRDELARVQAEARRGLTQLRAENESLSVALDRAQKVLTDLSKSRGYWLIRRLGRWDSLERGIRRALK